MTVYRKPLPYRKPQTYRGEETAVPTVPPGFFGGISTPYRDADDHFAATVTPWVQAPPRTNTIETSWEHANELGRAITMAWRQARAHVAEVAMPWSAATPYAIHGRHPWLQSAAHDATTSTPWQDFVHKLSDLVGMPWVVPAEHQKAAALAWGTLAARSMRTSNAWRQLAKRGAYVALPWGFGHNYKSGYDTPWTNPPPDPGTPLTFPDLPVYIMIPTFTAVVIDGGADLKPLSFTTSGDVDSYDWSFELQIPAETFHLVNPATHPDKVEIRVTVNGFPASYLVTGATSNRGWGARGYTIRGGSRSRVLGDGAPTRTLLQADDYNAAQLADHEVDGTGWTVIWEAADWLVPGGTWTYQDLTPIAAMQQLAESVGATLETDMDALNIHVRSRYPVKPWEWEGATPYAIVPAAIMDSDSSEWQDGNNANGVYIYPQNATSGAFIRISGTAGDALAPMVVDPLLTDSGAQTDRGIQELAKAGIKQHEVVTIPLFPAPALPSLIPLRSMLQATDEAGDTWMCQVMAVTITATRGQAATSVRQTLTLERQFRT